MDLFQVRFKETCRRIEDGELNEICLENLNDAQGLKLAQAASSSRSLVQLSIIRSSLTDAFTCQILSGGCSDTLVYLELQNCQLDDDAVEALCEHLDGSAVRNLHLASNSIGDIGACAVAEAGEGLQILHMQNNQVRDLGAEALSILSDTLSELYCFGNPFGKRGKEYLRAASKRQGLTLIWEDEDDSETSQTSQTITSTTGDSTLGDLPLIATSRRKISTRRDNSDPEYHFETLLQKFEDEQSDHDETSTCSQAVECDVGQAFLRMHYNDHALKCIDLAEITAEYAHSIAHNLKPFVRELCLTYSGLDATFTSNFEYKHLLILDLGSNALGDEGVEALIENWSTALNFLNLPDNNIGDIGACAIAEVAASLQSLCICENVIGALGAQALSELELDYLFCWDNPFGETGKQYLKKAADKRMGSEKKLHWVRPFHWDQELHVAREKALIGSAPSVNKNSLRKTKEKLPTSPEYNEARRVLEERYAAMREKFVNRGSEANADQERIAPPAFVVPNEEEHVSSSPKTPRKKKETAAEQQDRINKSLLLLRRKKQASQKRGVDPGLTLDGEKPKFGYSVRNRKGGSSTPPRISLSARSYEDVAKSREEAAARPQPDPPGKHPRQNTVVETEEPKDFADARRQMESLERQFALAHQMI